MELPDFLPRTEIWVSPAGYVPKPGPYPKIQRLGDYLAIDWYALEATPSALPDWHDAWIEGKGDWKAPFKVKVWLEKDAPGLAELPDDAPEAVKNLYRKRGQLLLLRSKSDEGAKLIDSALSAWESYTNG